MSAPFSVVPARQASRNVVGGGRVTLASAEKPGWTVLARPARRPVALPLETLVEGEAEEGEER